MMDFIRRGKDLNFLALTDLEAMQLSNLLSQYSELATKTEQGNHSRKVLAKKIDAEIKKGIK